LISSILPRNLQQTYGLNEQQARNLIWAIHSLFNYRFSKEVSDFKPLADPLLLISTDLQAAGPQPFVESLRDLGAFISHGGFGAHYFTSGTLYGQSSAGVGNFSGSAGQNE